MNNITVAVDFSQISLEALKWAKYLAQKAGSQLHIIHVLPDTSISFSQSISEELLESLLESKRKSEERRLKNLVSSVKKNNSVKALGTLLQGTPHIEIVKYARQANSDLIVMGTRGLSDIESLLIGSVASRVIRISEIPVMVLRRKRKLVLKRMIALVDFSPHSLSALSFAKKFAEIFNLSLHVVHCIETKGVKVPENILRKMKEDAEKKLRAKIKDERGEYSIIHSYDLAEGVNEFVEKNKIDIIVMGSHGRSEIGKIFFGSNAEKVIRQSPVPVIVIRKEKES